MCGENLGYRKLSLECVKCNILLKNFPIRRDKVAKGGKITMIFAREEGCKFPAWKSASFSLWKAESKLNRVGRQAVFLEE